ncbi:hypothetical protein FOIG_15698 [Fusarium odoratissimum NRRL 54006]|uniref:Uncharacterized protein n=2 Tax=Fusarium oxysporum species complex TaxID=171631 RepID=X0K233_FUSO5|nr:uncharacterized protein FOIG_15698 [Fusarium odoratissimum NRRL 54006]EXL91124.1 hypothetical protein FOIG_15698 [Fusarium odoratissimum NRRL 54006]TXB98860.1 hypothetical protein FocTR4_00013534 [Fusarium oxysporum f. sp. cubense]
MAVEHKRKCVKPGLAAPSMGASVVNHGQSPDGSRLSMNSVALAVSGHVTSLTLPTSIIKAKTAALSLAGSTLEVCVQGLSLARFFGVVSE